MSNRFEDLEEQLKRLETIPLVATATQGHAAEGQVPWAAGGQRPIPTKTQNSNGETAQDSRLSKGHDEIEPEREEAPAASGPLARVARVVLRLCGWEWRTQLRALQDQAVTDCQDRMREVVGNVIEDARRQLEGLTNELVPSLQMRLEKSMETSVGTLTSQLPKQPEEQVQSATGRGGVPTSVLEREEAAETVREWRKTRETTEAEQTVDGDRIQQQLTEAFGPVVEEIQLKSAAFLDRLNVQLHSALQAFGEKATKHAAEEFARIAIEVLQRDVRRDHAPQYELRAPETVGLGPGSQAAEVGKLSAERQAVSALQSAGHKSANSGQPSNGLAGLGSGGKSGRTQKLPGSAPNWRILGLG
jgi:hypothetical protein